jgi:hypothetical protein
MEAMGRFLTKQTGNTRAIRHTWNSCFNTNWKGLEITARIVESKLMRETPVTFRAFACGIGLYQEPTIHGD